jgi:hypothetical protein
MWIFDARLLCAANVLEMIDRAPTIDHDLTPSFRDRATA